MARRRSRGAGYLPGGTGEALSVIGRIDNFHLIQFPSKRWGFVGRVPTELMYRYKDGSPVSSEDARLIAQHGAGLFRSRIDHIAFDSPADALAAARALGVRPANAAEYETGSNHGRYGK